MLLAEGRRRHDWDQTSLVAALLYNAHRGTAEARPVEDFHPCPPPRPPIPRSSVSAVGLLKRLFVDQQPPQLR